MFLAGCFSGLPLNPFLVLDLLLHGLNRVGSLDIKRNRLPCQGLDHDLVPHDVYTIIRFLFFRCCWKELFSFPAHIYFYPLVNDDHVCFDLQMRA